jgi:SAM-dependent methyltransferase
MQADRREFLDELIRTDELCGLEIGALHRPIIKRDAFNSNGSIYYLDYAPTSVLRENYINDPTVDLDDIVEVDFVCPNGDLEAAVGSKRFDYIVASHVIEHVPNPIKFLKQINMLLHPGGVLLLVIPDKRFTFDIQRPLSTFGDLLGRYFENTELPPVSAVYDHFACAMAVDGHKVWTGQLNAEELLPITDNAIAWRNAKQAHDEKIYHDVHVNIFTPQSFFDILERIVKNDLVLWEGVAFQDTQPGKIDFSIALEKPKKDGEWNKQKCLSAFPEFSFKTSVLPHVAQVESLNRVLRDLTQTHSDLSNSHEKAKAKIISLKKERTKIKKELADIYTTLNRKSVKLTLVTVHKLYSFFRKIRNN